MEKLIPIGNKWYNIESYESGFMHAYYLLVSTLNLYTDGASRALIDGSVLIVIVLVGET